jgi:hypothetical protein
MPLKAAAQRHSCTAEAVARQRLRRRRRRQQQQQAVAAAHRVITCVLVLPVMSHAGAKAVAGVTMYTRHWHGATVVYNESQTQSVTVLHKYTQSQLQVTVTVRYTAPMLPLGNIHESKPIVTCGESTRTAQHERK